MQAAKSNRPSGMSGFTVVWVGQLLSLLGSAMSQFGLTIWAFEQTGRATDLALINFFYMFPLLIITPFVGVLVDRYNRKFMMMVSDLGAGLVTIGIFVLYANGGLEIWHMYVAAVFNGLFNSFQWPAYSAAITLMLDKSQYTRANSMIQLAQSGSNIFAPLAAGALLAFIGLEGILIIDVVTFVFAVGTLFFVHIPDPERVAEEVQNPNMWKEIAYGFRYLKERPSLLLLQTVFMVGNFFATLSFTLFAPMVLSRTGSNELIFGTVQTIGAVGGVLGGLIISAWGGFKRRIHGVLLGWLGSMAAMVIVGLGRGEPVWAAVPIWGAGMFITSAFIPLVNASNQAIWQSKIAPNVQGRIFSLRRLLAMLIIPVAQLIAGPLADNLLEPAMQPGGSLTGTFGWLVGTGPGAGMSLVFIFAGLAGVLVSISGYLLPSVRNVEDILPDFDAQQTDDVATDITAEVAAEGV